MIEDLLAGYAGHEGLRHPFQMSVASRLVRLYFPIQEMLMTGDEEDALHGDRFNGVSIRRDVDRTDIS